MFVGRPVGMSAIKTAIFTFFGISFSHLSRMSGCHLFFMCQPVYLHLIRRNNWSCSRNSVRTITKSLRCSVHTRHLASQALGLWMTSNLGAKTIFRCHQSSFLIIHLVVCLTTGPKPYPKRALHIVRSRASSFTWEYPLLSLRSSNSFIRLLPCLPVTSIPPCTFPSVTLVEGSFDAKCDQYSSPSVYVFHVGYSSAPWL